MHCLRQDLKMTRENLQDIERERTYFSVGTLVDTLAEVGFAGYILERQIESLGRKSTEIATQAGRDVVKGFRAQYGTRKGLTELARIGALTAVCYLSLL